MSSEPTRRIAKNTAALYVRMLLSMIVTLYTSRVVLEVLGVEDYGLYNVVGGIVVLFSFLNTSMSGATARFITFELGRNTHRRLQETFTSALIIHLGIAIVTLIVAETIGLWLLKTQLTIPEGRMQAASWIYQFSILAVMVSFTQVPYNASIIAHERMSIYAYIEILNVSLKLLIVYLLTLAHCDKLILYGALILGVNIAIASIYRLYCIRQFAECRVRWQWIPSILKPMLSFSGWDLYGNMSVAARTQGINILLNIFFGTVANAAAGIAAQVQSAVGAFANNIMTAVKPQIIKSYACGEKAYMTRLIYSSSRFMYLLLLVLSLPILVDTHFVLSIWLKTVPEYTTAFCRLTLLFNFFAILSTVLVTGVHATGNIKRPSLINGTLYLSVIPLTYIAFRFGGNPVVPFVCNVLFVCVGAIINLFSLKKYVPEISVGTFFMQVLGRVLCVSAASAILPVAILLSCDEGWLRFISIGVSSLITTLTFSYLLALNDQERSFVRLFIVQKLKRS